jgi:hypothetical protein
MNYLTTIIVRLLGVVLTALQTAPAPAPASAPPEISLATPKSAARSLYAAVERSDEAALREIFFAEDDDQRQLAGAYAHLMVQAKRLADAAKRKFPGASEGLAQGVVTAEQIAQLEQAAVEEKGDTAIVRPTTRGAKEMVFRKTAGGWRLVLTDLAGASKDGVTEQITVVSDLATAISETADDLAADKFASAQEAETALRTKVNAVVTRAVKTNPPTTAPAATSPSR